MTDLFQILVQPRVDVNRGESARGETTVVDGAATFAAIFHHPEYTAEDASPPAEIGQPTSNGPIADGDSAATPRPEAAPARTEAAPSIQNPPVAGRSIPDGQVVPQHGLDPATGPSGNDFPVSKSRHEVADMPPEDRMDILHPVDPDRIDPATPGTGSPAPNLPTNAQDKQSTGGLHMADSNVTGQASPAVPNQSRTADQERPVDTPIVAPRGAGAPNAVVDSTSIRPAQQDASDRPALAHITTAPDRPPEPSHSPLPSIWSYDSAQTTPDADNPERKSAELADPPPLRLAAHSGNDVSNTQIKVDRPILPSAVYTDSGAQHATPWQALPAGSTTDQAGHEVRSPADPFPKGIPLTNATVGQASLGASQNPSARTDHHRLVAPESGDVDLPRITRWEQGLGRDAPTYMQARVAPDAEGHTNASRTAQPLIGTAKKTIMAYSTGADRGAGALVLGDVLIEGPTLAPLEPRLQATAAHLPMASAPVATPTPSAAVVVQQLVQAAPGLASGPIEVSLAPDELGRVRMTLHHTDNGLAMTILADRDDTLALLRRNLEMLSTDLQNLGFENLSFSFGGGGDGGAPDGGPSRGALPEKHDALATPAPIQRSSAGTETEKLDIRL